MPVPEASLKSLFDKLWDAHVVKPESDATPAVIYIDLHLVHEVTSPQGFDLLREKGIAVRRPDRTLATIDHSTPTLPAGEDGQRPYITEQAQRQVQTLRENCSEFGIELHDWDSPSRGIVHVMGPELGATQPGMTIVCGDSHTSTHGAFGALAFGIGTTEVGHVLATQCLLQRKPKSLGIRIEGELGPGVTAKDVILHIIRTLDERQSDVIEITLGDPIDISQVLQYRPKNSMAVLFNRQDSCIFQFIVSMVNLI